MNSMRDFLEKAGPALVGLAGTLLVALLGFYQWRKQQSAVRRADYTAAKSKAYEGLWNKLEEINLQLRDNRGANPMLYAQLKDANTFFLQHSLYLQADEQELINRYITALHRLRTAIYTSGDEDVAAAWEKTWTGVPPELDLEIGQASKQVDAIRQDILSRVKKVVSAR